MTLAERREQIARTLAGRWLGRMAHRLEPEDERQKLENIWRSFEPDADAILALPPAQPSAALGELLEAMKPFAKKWAALQDPLPQGPFTLIVDAMDCCRAAQVYAKYAKETT